MKKGNKKKRVENRKLHNANVYNNDNEMAKLLKIVGIIVAFLAVFFILVNVFNPKTNNTDEKKEIQYTSILAANILKQKPTSYYVLVEYKDDSNTPLYETYLSSYKTNHTDGHYYFVDLSNSFNIWSIGDDNKLTIDNINDIRFNQTVLLYINNGKVENSFAGVDSIKAQLIAISAKS